MTGMEFSTFQKMSMGPSAIKIFRNLQLLLSNIFRYYLLLRLDLNDVTVRSVFSTAFSEG